MKKLLLVLGLLLIPSVSQATILDIPSYVSGADVTISNLQLTNTTIENWANGNVEGGGINIKAGSINTSDLSAAVSPINRWDESFNDYTVSGMLPATSANLASDISAGVSYVSGYRVETAATNHTYTASKDTYVYINKGSYFVYSEVANGASAPATPSNTLLLAKVVTSGSAITSVSDLRTLTINITATTSNFPSDYREQAYVSIDSTTATHIEPGSIAIGTSIYTTTADSSSKSVGTAGNWIEGSAPNIKNLKFYVYAYNNSGSQFDFKYSSADPVYSDSSSNTGGTLQYYTTGGTTYRAMAWISGDTNATVVGRSFGQFPTSGIINRTTYETGEFATGTGLIPADDTPPLITEGDEYMNVTFRPSNSNSTLRIDVVFNYSTTASTQITAALFRNTTSTAIAAAADRAAANDKLNTINFTHYMTAGTTSPIIFRLRAGDSSGGTLTFNGISGARIFGGVMSSSITVTEIQG